MKLNKLLTGMLLLTVLISGSLLAQDSKKKKAIKTYNQPVLLTSVGQAADVLIMKGLCRRAGVKVSVQNLATADSLVGYKTLILVAGGSSKGLGAAKIDVSDEEERGRQLIKAAQKAGIPVLAFHIGGEARRGVLSDRFNELAAKGGEIVVIASDGDNDKLFAKAAKKNKARYIHVERSIDVIGVLQELFPKPKLKE